jgi:hypothetical protein
LGKRVAKAEIKDNRRSLRDAGVEDLGVPESKEEL